MNTLTQILCPTCRKTLPIDSFFCSYCGAKIREVKINTSISKQIIIYLVSFFLAPFGLGYAVKYIKQADPKAKNIGMVSIVLTILAVVFMLWFGFASINYYSEMLKTLTI